MNSVGLKQYIKKIVKEQVDLRTLDGRELKQMLQTVLEKQQALDSYAESIASVLAKQKELEGELKLAHKVLFNRMDELQHTTLQVADTVAEIVQEPKYKRVEPTYKVLYEKAVESLARFSQEQSNLIESAKQAEILAKKAEQVKSLKLKKVQTEQFEPMKNKFGDLFKKVIAFLFGKLKSTIQAGNEALINLNSLKNA